MTRGHDRSHTPTMRASSRASMTSLVSLPSRPSPLDRARLTELQEAFRMFDHDGDGNVDADELGTVLNSVGRGYTPEQIKRIIKQFDTDGDGHIQFAEFVTMMDSAESKRDEGQELKDAFAVFDKDGDGSITAAELLSVMTALGENIDKETIRIMIDSVDTDGDGEIGLDEFITLMRDGPPVLT